MTTITIINPVSGAVVDYDITGLTQDQLDEYALYMDTDTREAVNSAVAPCTPEAFLAEYVSRVGAEAAGIIILG